MKTMPSVDVLFEAATFAETALWGGVHREGACRPPDERGKHHSRSSTVSDRSLACVCAATLVFVRKTVFNRALMDYLLNLAESPRTRVHGDGSHGSVRSFCFGRGAKVARSKWRCVAAALEGGLLGREVRLS